MEIRRGIVKAFDPASYTATVQVAGSLGNWLAGVPVAKHLAAGLLTSGARCGVIFFDPANPQDACLAFVYEGTPGAWVSDGMLEGDHDAGKHTNRTRTIPCRAVTGTYATDGLGDSHIELPDGGTTYTYWEALIPTDYAGGAITAYARFVSHAASTAKAWVMELISSYTRSAGSGGLGGGTQTLAVPAGANTVATDASQALSSPAAGDRVSIRLARVGAHAADTYPANIGLLGVRLEYTADM